MKKIKRSFKQILISGLSMACGLSLALGVGNFFFQSYFTKANAETTVDAIVSPRYIYDTSISDGVLGVGSTLALPKATIQNSLNGNDVASAAVTILYNGTVVEGYNETELYSNDFTFANAGNYDIIYSYAHSSETPKDYYRLNVTQDAPVIKATERTPYTVATNTEIKLPQLEMTFNGAAVDYVVNLYYPDETAYRFKDTVLEQDGLYKIEFKTEINQTVYTYVKSIYAYGTNVDFTGKQTPYYGTSSFEKTMETMKSYTDKDGADKLVWTDGLNVAFEKGDVFTYQKPINLKELGSMDKLIKFYVEPTGATEIYFYVDLVDVNDSNNVLSVRFSSVPEATGSRSYRTWVSAAATGIGQEFVGRRYMDGGVNDILYVDRHAGAYTCVDVSGLVNTELYYPLSFAYDEDAKQVYTGLVDRAST